jgi:hypothetical protein
VSKLALVSEQNKRRKLLKIEDLKNDIFEIQNGLSHQPITNKHGIAVALLLPVTTSINFVFAKDLDIFFHLFNKKGLVFLLFMFGPYINKMALVSIRNKCRETFKLLNAVNGSNYRISQSQASLKFSSKFTSGYRSFTSVAFSCYSNQLCCCKRLGNFVPFIQ